MPSYQTLCRIPETDLRHIWNNTAEVKTTDSHTPLLHAKLPDSGYIPETDLRHIWNNTVATPHLRPWTNCCILTAFIYTLHHVQTDYLEQTHTTDAPVPTQTYPNGNGSHHFMHELWLKLARFVLPKLMPAWMGSVHLSNTLKYVFLFVYPLQNGCWSQL